jgi:hypothetical protein
MHSLCGMTTTTAGRRKDRVLPLMMPRSALLSAWGKMIGYGILSWIIVFAAADTGHHDGPGGTAPRRCHISSGDRWRAAEAAAVVSHGRSGEHGTYQRSLKGLRFFSAQHPTCEQARRRHDL